MTHWFDKEQETKVNEVTIKQGDVAMYDAIIEAAENKFDIDGDVMMASASTVNNNSSSVSRKKKAKAGYSHNVEIEAGYTVFRIKRDKHQSFQSWFASIDAKEQKKWLKARKAYQKGEQFTLIHALQEEENPMGFAEWCAEETGAKPKYTVEQYTGLFKKFGGKFKDFGEYARSWNKKEEQRWYTRKLDFKRGKRAKIVRGLLEASIPKVHKWLNSDNHKTFDDDRTTKGGKAGATRSTNQSKMDIMKAKIAKLEANQALNTNERMQALEARVIELETILERRVNAERLFLSNEHQRIDNLNKLFEQTWSQYENEL